MRRSCVGWLPDHPPADVVQLELTAPRRRADLTIPEAISTVLSRPRYGSSGLLSWRRTEPLWVMLGERTCTERL